MSETWKPFWRNLPCLNNFKFPPPSYVNIPSSRLPCYFSSVSFQGVPFHCLHQNHIHNYEYVFQRVPRYTNKFKCQFQGQKLWRHENDAFWPSFAPKHLCLKITSSAREFFRILQTWNLCRSTSAFCLTPSSSKKLLNLTQNFTFNR